MPTDEEKEEIEEFQNNFFELLREFDAEGGANCTYMAYHYYPEFSCDICPCKTDNADKCILVTAQKLIEKWEENNNG